MSEITVNIYRGQIIESCHKGYLTVVNGSGETIYHTGDDQLVTYWRSSAKPFQVFPLINSGAVKQFNFSDKELAVMASSHSGEKEHVKTVNSILKKIGLDQSALKCGIHPPYNKNKRKKGKKPEPVENNCSGKHASMLALCRYYDWDIDDYLKKEHPLQKLIIQVIADVTLTPIKEIITGEDGCGVPTFALPMEKMAFAFAGLGKESILPNKYQEAAFTIKKAIRRHPHMIAGTDRFNTDLLKVAGDRITAKSGAEGVFCAGINDQGNNFGFILKIEDGNKRAIPPVITELLYQLNILTDKDLDFLKKYHSPEIKNHRGHITGKIKAEISLD